MAPSGVQSADQREILLAAIEHLREALLSHAELGVENLAYELRLIDEEKPRRPHVSVFDPEPRQQSLGRNGDGARRHFTARQRQAATERISERL